VRQIPLPPGVEHQEAPEDPLMIPDARDVLENQPTYRGRLEEAYPFDRVEGQALLERSVQRAAQPRTERYAKALLPTGKDGVRNQAPERTLQDVLGSPPFQLERRWHVRGELHERAIEKRRSHLEPALHARPVHRDEILVREIARAVLIDERVEGTPIIEPGHERGQLLMGIDVGAARSSGWRK